MAGLLPWFVPHVGEGLSDLVAASSEETEPADENLGRSCGVDFICRL